MTRLLMSRLRLLTASKYIPKRQMIHTRLLSSETGEILAKPERKRFGLVKVCLVVVPFLFFGGMISREGAAWLEDNDIFSPEEED